MYQKEICLNVHTWAVFRRGRVESMPCAEEPERHPLYATNLPQSLLTVLPLQYIRVISPQSSPTERECPGAYPQLSKRIPITIMIQGRIVNSRLAGIAKLQEKARHV
jgi:hypothetical protein